jgi:REP element-mobilizing transposase RayT
MALDCAMKSSDHWKNWAKDGQASFVTTTALDFSHVFMRPEMRELAAALLISDCARYGAPLYAFVVMTHHVHFVVQCPAGRTISYVVQRIKSNTAKILLSKMTARELAGFDEQRGLNGRSFWKVGFRSVVIDNDVMLGQKIDYIHNNPIRAGLADTLEGYRWSSARLYARGDLSSSTGLDLVKCLGEFHFEPDEMLVSSALRRQPLE